MTQEPRQPAPKQPPPKQPAPDPLGDFQRWLMKSSARSLGHQVRGNVRKTLGYGGSKTEDVWSVATSEVPEEPPECEWCPVCRAARKFRDSGRGPGLGSHLSSAGEAFASVLNDAVSAFETAVSAAKPPPGSAAGEPAGAGPPTAAGPDAASAGPPAAAGPQAASAGPQAAAPGPGVKKPGPKAAGTGRAKAAGAKAAAGAGTGRPAGAGPKRPAGTTAGEPTAGKPTATGAKAPGGTKPRKPPAAGKAGADAGAWAEAADPVTRAAKRPAAGGTRERAVDDPDDRG
jgi:hypothetical protein